MTYINRPLTMPRELKKTIDQTKDVEGQIRSALQSRLKRDILWIVTESDYDRTVYEQFFNDNVAVKPSYDERGDGGCDRVMRIVESIKKLKLPKVWDYTSIPQRLKNGWKRILTDQYNRLTGEDINPKRLSALKKRYALDDLEYGHICRGHDFVQLLGIAMVDTRFSSDKIETKLGELYSKADFSGTNLAQNIRAFAAGYGLVVM